MELQYTLQVAATDTPRRIDVYLSTRLRKFSRNKIQTRIHRQAVLVNDKPVQPDYLVSPGDIICIYNEHKEFTEPVTPEDIPLDIVFEDEYLIVINKPGGMPVHKGLGNYRGTLLNALAFHFNKSNSMCKAEEGMIHRLDSGTSGLIVFSKNKASRISLEKQLKNHQIRREYVALVYGTPKSGSGVIDVPVGKDPDQPKVIRAFPDRDGGKEAVTYYAVEENLNLATLVGCRLETGRTHQIRIHMQFAGHALLGDTRYPPSKLLQAVSKILEEEGVERHLLHAGRLMFTHPVSGETCVFEAPMPDDMMRVYRRLKERIQNL